jgi:hypothetical protein
MGEGLDSLAVPLPVGEEELPAEIFSVISGRHIQVVRRAGRRGGRPGLRTDDGVKGEKWMPEPKHALPLPLIRNTQEQSPGVAALITTAGEAGDVLPCLKGVIRIQSPCKRGGKTVASVAGGIWPDII